MSDYFFGLILCNPVWALFVGRVVQSIAGSATWIVAFATLTDNLGQQHMGKTAGLVTSFVTSGVIAGPVISGTVLEVWGYWHAWSIPIGMLAVDFMARLALIEKKKSSSTRSDSPRSPSGINRKAARHINETTGLLSSTNDSHTAENDKTNTSHDTHSGQGFYQSMLTDIRVLTALLNNLVFSIMISGFDTTLPLHCRSEFGSGTFSVSMIFLALQSPALILNPVIGWLRDRVGVRYPTTAGWFLLAPLLWLLGNSQFKGVMPDTMAIPIFVATILSIGIISVFIRGADTIQLICKCSECPVRSLSTQYF